MRSEGCVIARWVTVAIALAVHGVAMGQSPPPKCDVNCKTLTKRFALVIEYELCSASELLRTAVDDKRIVPVNTATVTLSGPAKCWHDWAVKGNLPDGSHAHEDSFMHVVVPATQALRQSPDQAMSFDFAPLRACLGARRAEGLPPAHRDITFAALQAPGLVTEDSANTNLISLASEQADKFLWTKPYAHAQTPDDGDPALAQAELTRYVTKVAALTRDQCCRPDYAAAGYLLGYILHVVQDLATHRGMTNAFHSYEMSRGENPDVVYRERLQHAAGWSDEVIAAMSKKHGQCLAAAAKLTAPQTDTGWDRLAAKFSRGPNKLLNGRDGGALQMAAFLVPGYFSKQPKDVQWFSSGNAKAEAARLALDAVRAELSRGCEKPK